MGEVASGDVVGKLKAAEAKWLALTPHLAESLKPIAAQAVRAAASLPLLCRPAAVLSDGGGLNNPSDPLPSPPPAPLPASPADQGARDVRGIRRSAARAAQVHHRPRREGPALHRSRADGGRGARPEPVQVHGRRDAGARHYDQREAPRAARGVRL